MARALVSSIFTLLRSIHFIHIKKSCSIIRTHMFNMEEHFESEFLSKEVFQIFSYLSLSMSNPNRPSVKWYTVCCCRRTTGEGNQSQVNRAKHVQLGSQRDWSPADWSPEWLHTYREDINRVGMPLTAVINQNLGPQHLMIEIIRPTVYIL